MCSMTEYSVFGQIRGISNKNPFSIYSFANLTVTGSSNITPRTLSANVLSALQGVRFIAQHIRDADKDNEVNALARHKNFASSSKVSDSGRLEVRVDGVGPLLSVGLHAVVHWWYLRNHFSGSFAV